ncbi:membrane hypothetical protein [Frankia canadensis]|uniref:Histidine kinase/HSP90-like ATPase domain-containing protein n=1 Tax=Frankia canadensis TaxID=1836972 RepID=A0A2I2KL22_9ACTN|nr:ATP-binding protein [Frankia canadensis]SNQ46369.1 membrane hypothetical protein [Frankia canadensis]SOU53659.1 membrane hypothetical protein [Frankia canadensis]
MTGLAGTAGPPRAVVQRTEQRMARMIGYARAACAAFVLIPLFGWTRLRYPGIAAGVAAGAIGEAAWFVWRVWPGNRLSRRLVLTDVAFCVALMLVGSRAARPHDRNKIMTELVPFSLVSPAGVGFALGLGVAGIAAVVVLMAAWSLAVLPDVTLKLCSDLLGFALWYVVALLIARELRALSERTAQAQEAAEAASRLAVEQEREAERLRQREITHREIHDYLLPIVDHVAGGGTPSPALIREARRGAQRARRIIMDPRGLRSTPRARPDTDDASRPDASRPDAGRLDAGRPDASTTDASATAGRPHSDGTSAGRLDAGATAGGLGADGAHADRFETHRVHPVRLDAHGVIAVGFDADGLDADGLAGSQASTDTLRAARARADRLAADTVEDGGLEAMMSAVVDMFADEGLPLVHFVAVRDEPPEPVREAVVAATREALRNVVRHAGPVEEVSLFVEGDADGVLVVVRDRGVGFDPATVRPGGGLAGSYPAILRHGGRAEVHARPGGGVRVTLRWPAPPDAERGAR